MRYTASAPSGPEILYADPEETPLKRFHLGDADLFLTITISQFQMTSINHPSKAKVLLQRYWSLVNHS